MNRRDFVRNSIVGATAFASFRPLMRAAAGEWQPRSNVDYLFELASM